MSEYTVPQGRPRVSALDYTVDGARLYKPQAALRVDSHA